jgi:hypothetical protein
MGMGKVVLPYFWQQERGIWKYLSLLRVTEVRCQLSKFAQADVIMQKVDRPREKCLW